MTSQPTYGGDHLIGGSSVPSEGRCVIAWSAQGSPGWWSEESARLVLGPHLVMSIVSFEIAVNHPYWFKSYVLLLTAQLECVSLEGDALMGESYLFTRSLHDFGDLFYNLWLVENISKCEVKIYHNSFTAGDSLVPGMRKGFGHSWGYRRWWWWWWWQ